MSSRLTQEKKLRVNRVRYRMRREWFSAAKDEKSFKRGLSSDITC